MLSHADQERIFQEHGSDLRDSRRREYHRLIDATEGISLITPWEEAKELISCDPRYKRFGKDDSLREVEYNRYKGERKQRAIEEFKQLLEETKSITHESYDEVIKPGSVHLREIQTALQVL